jgi:uncharacterized protein YutE (UPF0331/DUF86 family)
LLALDEVLSHLAGHAGRPASLLRTSVDERWTVERGLLLCTQHVLDLATHIAASAGRDAPDYRTAIDELGRLDVISADLAARLLPLAGFRNALVHGYLAIDVDRIHGVLNDHLDDVREFARQLDAYVTKSPGP